MSDRSDPSAGTAPAKGPQFNDAESPLSWLRARKSGSGKPLISDEQYLAGERLRADFERAMLSQRVTASWDPASAAVRAGGPRLMEPSDSAIAARLRFHQAIEAAGPELAGILYQVCCLASGLEQAERHLRLPQRSGKAVLGLALTALVRHYRLGAKAPRVRTGQWGIEGYRPEIQALEDA